MAHHTFKLYFIAEFYISFVYRSHPPPQTGDLGFQIIVGGCMSGEKDDPESLVQHPKYPYSSIRRRSELHA